MFTHIKLACVVGAIAALVAAATASAQSFDPSVGTGNAISCYYDRSGALQVWTPGAADQNGASAFAYVPGAGADGSCHPALTGGGSIGYNQGLLHD